MWSRMAHAYARADPLSCCTTWRAPVRRERLTQLDAAILPFAALRSALARRPELVRKEICARSWVGVCLNKFS
jgi:hypothetical protein